MVTELQYTSSIFQLAFGVNAVFLWLLEHYTVIKRQIIEDFIKKIEVHKPNTFIRENRRILIKYVSKTFRGYKIIQIAFVILFFVALSSCGLSLFYLLYAALMPNVKISYKLLSVLSVIFIIINPILYFSYINASNKITSIIRSKMEVPEEYVKLIELSISSYKALETLDDKYIELQVKILKNKYARIKNNVILTISMLFNPIKLWNEIHFRIKMKKIKNKEQA